MVIHDIWPLSEIVYVAFALLSIIAMYFFYSVCPDFVTLNLTNFAKSNWNFTMLHLSSLVGENWQQSTLLPWLQMELADTSLLTAIFTRGQFWPSGIVVACVCLSVCVSVCVCVRQPRACPRHKSPRVQATTTKFGQKVQNNLVKVPIVLGAIDLDLQGQI